jgi:phosphonoacetaldehyde hydrolase
VDFGSLAPARTLQQLFSRVRISLTEPETRRDMGLSKKDHIRAILSIPRIRQAWQEAQGKFPTEADVEEIYQQFIPLQFSYLAGYSTLIPGASRQCSVFAGGD